MGLFEKKKGNEISGKKSSISQAVQEIPRISDVMSKKISAYDPQGPNMKTYDPNADEIGQLKLHTTQISEITQQAFSLFKKKMSIKSEINSLKKKVESGEMNNENYQYYLSNMLKGMDEYKVYEMYDNYIGQLFSQMRSYADGIFSTLDQHRPEIPVLKRSEIEAMLAAKAKSQESKKEKEKLEANWQTKADDFLNKRKEKKSFIDEFADKINNTLSPEADKQKVLKQLEKRRSPYRSQGSRLKIFIDWFLGKSDENPFAHSDDSGVSRKDSAIDRFIKEHEKSPSVVGGQTAFSDKFKNLRKMTFENKDEFMQRDMESSGSIHDVMKDIEESKKPKSVSYKPTSYTALANVLMKDWSLELINSFPDFFKGLYKELRLANMKVLSSTYTNTMMFSSIIAGTSILLLSSFISVVSFVPISVVIANGFLGGILGLSGTAIGYYYYPKYKVKERERKINANLPFAIDHMAAVVSAGVAPTSMFSLISQSREYNEVSVELEKIVEYIELFGYDMLTAVETVAAQCPSKQMKEFLEGFVSTVESGGELKDYLRESSDGAMLHYKLERQKFTESISTFSDIYTGLMVASPLFFVAALSMVSILGGAVGNVDVNTLMVMGTYVAIPLLNMMFIAFMELTQPSV